MTLLHLLLILFSSKASPGGDASFSIARIEANLFYADKGTFSGNVIDDPDFIFANAFIGEGSSEGLAEQTLIKVSVRAAGKGDQFGQSRADGISLVVTVTGGRTTTKRIFHVGLFNESRMNTYAVLLDDTGCDKVSIKAELVGMGVDSRMEKTIPFVCGD